MFLGVLLKSFCLLSSDLVVLFSTYWFLFFLNYILYPVLQFEYIGKLIQCSRPFWQHRNTLFGISPCFFLFLIMINEIYIVVCCSDCRISTFLADFLLCGQHWANSQVSVNWVPCYLNQIDNLIKFWQKHFIRA